MGDQTVEDCPTLWVNYPKIVRNKPNGVLHFYTETSIMQSFGGYGLVGINLAPKGKAMPAEGLRPDANIDRNTVSEWGGGIESLFPEILDT